MEDILELANKLGEAIAADPRFKAVVEMEEQISKDDATGKLLDDFAAQQLRIHELESEMKPVEPEDKHRLQDLHDRVTSNDLIKKLSAAQFEYADLMRQVDEAIQSKLRPPEIAE